MTCTSSQAHDADNVSMLQRTVRACKADCDPLFGVGLHLSWQLGTSFGEPETRVSADAKRYASQLESFCSKLFIPNF